MTQREESGMRDARAITRPTRSGFVFAADGTTTTSPCLYGSAHMLQGNTPGPHPAPSIEVRRPYQSVLHCSRASASQPVRSLRWRLPDGVELPGLFYSLRSLGANGALPDDIRAVEPPSVSSQLQTKLSSRTMVRGSQTSATIQSQ